MVLKDLDSPLPCKNKNYSEWFDGVLQKAELVDVRYNLKGFIVYRPNIMYMVRRVYEVFENLLFRTNHQPAYFPSLIPFTNLRKESEHIKGFDAQVFKVTEAGGERLTEDLFLRPTSETAIYPMFSLWIRSYKDLPLKVFQSVPAYRHETKATRPLLRGREFLWTETHCAFTNENKARQQVKEDLEIAKKAFRQLGIPFLMVERESYDRFYGAVNSYAFDTLLPDGRALQIATTHYLGKNFSDEKVFDIKFIDQEGLKNNVHQTCYGIGVSRILAAIISIHGDEYGLVLPLEAAHIQAVIIPVPKVSRESDIIEKCKRVLKSLEKSEIRTELDDSDNRPGEKYYKWEMLGAPIRIEVGEKELDGDFVTLFRRDTRKRERLSDDKLIPHISELKNDILKELGGRAWDDFNSSIVSVEGREDLQKSIERAKIIRAPFCGDQGCAEEIKNETGLEVRGRRIDIDERPSGNCFYCSKKANRVVYLARAY
jgi:prolyl-tRNA synthetase